ncbi:MAG: hypothetical protein H6622_17515 [Halobacteriovoraceae bacterium]|nr:hypothetical protein [Halobacteriovoraceae bacterium]
MRILTQFGLILTITLTFKTGFLYAGKFDYTLPKVDHSSIEKTSQAANPIEEKMEEEKTLYRIGNEQDKRSLASQKESPQRNPSSQEEEGLQKMHVETMEFDDADPTP